jgi:hypothetical protein
MFEYFYIQKRDNLIKRFVHDLILIYIYPSAVALRAQGLELTNKSSIKGAEYIKFKHSTHLVYEGVGEPHKSD